MITIYLYGKIHILCPHKLHTELRINSGDLHDNFNKRIFVYKHNNILHTNYVISTTYLIVIDISLIKHLIYSNHTATV